MRICISKRSSVRAHNSLRLPCNLVHKYTFASHLHNIYAHNIHIAAIHIHLHAYPDTDTATPTRPQCIHAPARARADCTWDSVWYTTERSVVRVCVCVCVCLVCFHSPAAVNSIVIINIDSSAPARYRCKSKHHSWECEHVEYARGCLVCAVTQNRTAKGLDYLKQALAWYKEKVSQFRYVQESEFFIMAL